MCICDTATAVLIQIDGNCRAETYRKQMTMTGRDQ